METTNNNNTGKVDVDKAGAILNSFTTATDTDTDAGTVRDVAEEVRRALARMSPENVKLVPDASADIKQDDPVIIIDGVPVACKGDILAVKGAEKVGKSQFAALIAAAVISPRAVGRQVWVPNGKKMIIFDTEQTDRSVRLRMMRGIRTAMREDATIKDNFTSNGVFIYVELRDKNTAERLATMKQFIAEIDPDIVYIDGVVQLMRDFNDVKETTDAMDALKALTVGSGSHRRVLVAVLHSNPTDAASAEEKKMRGHIGTMLAQSAQCVIALSRKSDADGNPVFTAKTSYARDEKDTGLSFMIRKDGTGDYFEILEDPEITAVRDMFTQVAEIAEREKQPLTRTYAAQVLMDKVADPRSDSRPKRTKAFELVDKAVKLNFLEEHGGQLYFDAHR